MQQDDRIFAVVGACIVVAVALVAAIIWLGSLTPASQIVESGLADEGDDGLIRSAVARLSSHPEFTSYLVNDRLLRRFVLSVDAIAGGYSPSNELEFLRPLKPFYVSEDEGRLVVASGTYRRYNVVSDVFTSIDANGAVEIYREFRPRLEAIYREVGWANDDFDTRLREAVDHLLEVNAPTGQIEVEQRAIVYAYAEDRFENLTDGVARTGPGDCDGGTRVVLGPENGRSAGDR
jgi:hypothetical protein